MRRRWDGTSSKALQPSLLRVPGSPTLEELARRA
jgi:hypothetical protein